jgi:hypothetical protein
MRHSLWIRPGRGYDRSLWLKLIILAIQEAEIGKIVFLGQPRQKVWEIPSQPMAGLGGTVHLSSQLGREAQIERSQSRLAQT